MGQMESEFECIKHPIVFIHIYYLFNVFKYYMFLYKYINILETEINNNSWKEDKYIQ